MRSNERTLFVLHFVLITKLIKVFDIIFESAVLHTFFLKKRQKKEKSTISWGMYLIIPKLTMKKNHLLLFSNSKKKCVVKDLQVIETFQLLEAFLFLDLQN